MSGLQTAALAVVLWPAAVLLFGMAAATAAATTGALTPVAPVTADSSAPAPVIRVIDVDGIATEVMEWEGAAAGGAPPVTFVMFPGNPGAVDFYRAYLGGVAAACPAMRVVCVGHASHSARVASRARYNLAAQIAHKAAYLRREAAAEPRRRFILAGHSVGAHIALEAARGLPPATVAQFVLLTPTLRHIGATPNGRRLTPFFNHFRGAAWLATYAVAALPAAVQRAVLTPFMTGGDASAALVLVHPDVAANALYLAAHEMREIREIEPSHMTAVAPKTVAFFAATDDWVLPEDPDVFASRFPRATIVRCTEGHRHAFVLSPASSARLASHTWRWIRHVVEGGSGGSGDEGAVDKGVATAPATFASPGRSTGSSTDRDTLLA